LSFASLDRPTRVVAKVGMIFGWKDLCKTKIQASKRKCSLSRVLKRNNENENENKKKVFPNSDDDDNNKSKT